MSRPIRDIALDVIEAVGGDREFWATLDKLKDAEKVIASALDEGRQHWSLPPSMEPVVQALSKLYERYYADAPESTKWAWIKEALEELMEAYDAWLD
jgi:hypothetical protein